MEDPIAVTSSGPYATIVSSGLYVSAYIRAM